ncbi:MAG: putative transcriptional regulator [Ignavibacteria bacterium]|nr:putative transcriptional regulator [Ignavibacteria bacterium]
MLAVELKELIAEGESLTLEFKRKVTEKEKFAKEITALANTRGGIILVGVDDDGTIYGIESEKSDIDIVEQICRFEIQPPITPELEIIAVKNKFVLVLYIDESNEKPHTIMIYDNERKNIIRRAYIRMGDKSVIASREMYRYLVSRNRDIPLTIGIGENEKRLFAYLEKAERITVNDFAGLVNISIRRAERLLIRLVQAGVLHIHNDMQSDYFTLIDINEFKMPKLKVKIR